MATQALAGLKVLDLTWHIAGPYCTKLLADMGADVIKVERPGVGDPSRTYGPFQDDKQDPEKSGLFVHLNNNKRGITLNLKNPDGVAAAKDLAKWADIVVENFSPGVMARFGLDFDTLSALNPGLVMASISAFGQTSRYRDYKATDLQLQAQGSYMIRTGGDADKPPIRMGGPTRHMEWFGGGLSAGIVLAATFGAANGKGTYLDIALMETSLYTYQGGISMEQVIDPGFNRKTIPPNVEKCKDGYVGLSILTGQQWVDLCTMMDFPEWGEDEDFQTAAMRMVNQDRLVERMQPWLDERTVAEIVELGTAFRLPVAPVSTPETIFDLPQFKERGDYWITPEHPKLGKVTQPGAPYRFAATPWAITRPSPQLGEHNEDVFSRVLEYSTAKVKDLKASGAI